MCADVFSRKFRKDRTQAAVAEYQIEVDADMTVEELLEEAYAQGVRTGGNTWAGPFEIQTDEGVWRREDGEALKRGKAVFRTWDEIEAAELAEVAA